MISLNAKKKTFVFYSHEVLLWNGFMVYLRDISPIDPRSYSKLCDGRASLNLWLLVSGLWYFDMYIKQYYNFEHFMRVLGISIKTFKSNSYAHPMWLVCLWLWSLTKVAVHHRKHHIYICKSHRILQKSDNILKRR